MNTGDTQANPPREQREAAWQKMQELSKAAYARAKAQGLSDDDIQKLVDESN